MFGIKNKNKNKILIIFCFSFFKRYFQCKTNHGIFVPHDKVVLASRERTYVYLFLLKFSNDL
jgi:hypothetical protein